MTELTVSRLRKNSNQSIKWMRGRIDYFDCYHFTNDVTEEINNYLGKNYFFDRVLIVQNLNFLNKIEKEKILLVLKTKGNFTLVNSLSNFDNDLEFKKNSEFFVINIVDNGSNEENENDTEYDTSFHLSLKILLELFISGYTERLLLKKIFKKNYRKSIAFLKKANLIKPLFIHGKKNSYYFACDTDKVFNIIMKQQYNDITKAADKLYDKLENPEQKWYCSWFVSDIKRNSLIGCFELLNLFSCVAKNTNYDCFLRQIDEIEKKHWGSYYYIYERGYAYYENGEHDKALKLFRQILDHGRNDSFINLIKIKIVEVSHGSVLKENILLINKIISDLITNKDTLFKLFAEYWNIHIEFEKGIFCGNVNLLNKLIDYNNCNSPKYIKNEYCKLLRRYYIDLIRESYISLQKIDIDSEKIKDIIDNSGFTEIIKEYKFYDLLYNEILKKQYMGFLELHLSNEATDDNINGLINEIKEGYENILVDKNASKKNLRTARGRKLDFDIICFAGIDIENSYMNDAQKVWACLKDFAKDSESTDVKIHEAYAYVLHIKRKILKILYCPDEFSDRYIEKEKQSIFDYDAKARKIYGNFNNSYGIFRLNFLNLLFKLALKKGEVLMNDFDDIKKLVEKNNYNREIVIIENLITYYNNHKDTRRKKIYDTLRFYNIILQ